MLTCCFLPIEIYITQRLPLLRSKCVELCSPLWLGLAWLYAAAAITHTPHWTAAVCCFENDLKAGNSGNRDSWQLLLPKRPSCSVCYLWLYIWLRFLMHDMLRCVVEGMFELRKHYCNQLQLLLFHCCGSSYLYSSLSYLYLVLDGSRNKSKARCFIINEHARREALHMSCSLFCACVCVCVNLWLSAL